MGSMYTTHKQTVSKGYSKGYRAAELYRTLPKSSAATAVRTEIGSYRFSAELSPSNQRLPWLRGRLLMAGNNHTGTASCSGAARRAADAFAALLRLLQQHAAYAVLEAP